ncbi:MAG: hypothetical protein ACTHVY_06325 [Brevibacterium yomogidense]|uniref:hypothetical protein n=1 Tax=Brevibacterium sp. Mu109 TaxID=1255669 RepID=UPI000C3C2819|nr:hypothetical protein [Brevibacterium sp. Mu109]SMX83860.1 hypothetical protein BSP109_01908 [Brevibacterium sp. Mu109]
MQEETVGLRERPGSAQERLIPTLKDRAAADDASPTPQDLEVQVPSTPHALADLARAIGDAGVSLEGGGMFAPGTAHYLVSVPDASASASVIDAVRRAGARSVRMNRVVLAPLDQETPGQLGALLTRLADAGVWVRTQYSDHAGALVLVVDAADFDAAHSIVASWESLR